eukprot:TRINITY_DN7223_c0_g1_i3.p1 TRINITY_DN7223_c0_g1~~TRINITY_DN7223_c0_g1_i3.p1  ORF type:complete len:112 (+),score=22.24 TRINITY_DN7223_c0_g1_i3:47-382(+)
MSGAVFEPLNLSIVVIGDDRETYEIFTRLKSMEYNAYYAETTDMARQALLTDTVAFEMVISPLKIGDEHCFDFLDWLDEAMPKRIAPYLGLFYNSCFFSVRLTLISCLKSI